MIDRLLAQKNLTQAEFARKVGIKKGTLSAIRLRQPIAGLPKCLNIETWSKELGLTREESRQLAVAAAVAYSPALVQRLLVELGYTADELTVRTRKHPLS